MECLVNKQEHQLKARISDIELYLSLLIDDDPVKWGPKISALKIELKKSKHNLDKYAVDKSNK